MVDACVVGVLSPPAPYPDPTFEKDLVNVDANSLRSPTSSSKCFHCAFLPVESDNDGFNYDGLNYNCKIKSVVKF